MQKAGPETHAIPARAALFTVFLCMLWGGLAPALKISLTGIPPLGSAGVRFLAAWLALVVWCRVRKIALMPHGREWAPLGIMGLVFAVQISLLNAGTQRTSAGHASVFLSTNPVFVAALSHFFLKGDRLTVPKLLGLVAALAGVWVIFSDGWAAGGSGHLGGDLIVLLSGFLVGCLVVYTKHLVDATGVHKIIVWQMTVSVPLFFLVGGLTEGLSYHFTLPVTLAMAYQSLCLSAFAFVAWTSLLKRFPASKLSAFSFSTPVFGILLSALLLSEPISRRLALGTGLVGVGIYLANRSFGDPREAAS
jgi:drug/metabolite transporter (DMT)-like permease